MPELRARHRQWAGPATCRDHKSVVAEGCAIVEDKSLGLPVDLFDTLAEPHLHLRFFIGDRILVDQRVPPDFAREKRLRQGRAHIGKTSLLADEDDAALEPVLPQKRRGLAARLAAADDGYGRCGAKLSTIHNLINVL